MFLRRSLVVWLGVFSALAQDPRSAADSPEAARRKRIAALLETIETTAATEPPQIGVDTWIRAAEAVAAWDPALAREFAGKAVESAGALKTAAARDTFLSLAGQALVKLDPEGAEEVCRKIPQRPAAILESDAKSACWAARIAREPPGAKQAVLERALEDRAYGTSQHAQVMSRLIRTDPESAALLYGRYVALFPRKDANGPELRALLAVVAAAGPEQMGLSRQALEMAIQRVGEEDFPEPTGIPGYRINLGSQAAVETGTLKEALTLVIADLAWLLAPDLLKTHQELLGRWRERVAGGDWQRRSRTRIRERDGGLDAVFYSAFGAADLSSLRLDHLKEAELRALLPGLRDARARVLVHGRLFELAQVDPKRLAKAREKYRESLKELPDSSRLKMLSYFLLFDEALTSDNLDAAVKLAPGLLASFEASLGCASEDCERAAAENLPGELAWDFVQYLEGKGKTPSDVGLSARTLDVRAALVELRALLRKPSRSRPQTR